MPDPSDPAAHRGPIWSGLLDAARAFCPPYEVVEERPGDLGAVLRRPGRGDDVIHVRYRTTRGLFLRSYNLLVTSVIAGAGPAQGGVLIQRRRRLVWKRPQPDDGRRWSERLASEEFRAAVKRLQLERLTLAWSPARAHWQVELETLSGGLTVTFFPPLVTPNPLRRDEAEAFADLVEAVRAALTR